MHDRVLNNATFLEPLRRTGLPVVIVNQKPWQLESEWVDVQDLLTIVHSPLQGISNSRNDGIHHADFDFGILCDDDVELMVENMQKLAEELAHSDHQPEILIHPLLRDASSPWRKGKFPAGQTIHKSQWLKWRKLHRINRMEIVLNLWFFKSIGIWFNPQLGLGSIHTSGGEAIELMSHVIRAGGEAHYQPLPLRIHHDASSGQSTSVQNTFNMGRVHCSTISPIWHEVLIVRYFIKYIIKPDGLKMFQAYVQGMKFKSPETP